MNHNPSSNGKDGREIACDDTCDGHDACLSPQARADEPEDLTTPVDSFDAMALKEDLLRGIYSIGFERPSRIQQTAIRPLAFSSTDIIAQAQSGTGKTATFAIGLLQNIEPTKNACQALILSPTRELARQSSAVAASLGRFLGVHVLACTGGASMREQASALRNGRAAHLVVGTPGRVLDLLEKCILEPSHIQAVVLDEADEMLDAGFQEQISQTLKRVPKSAKIGLFSATLPPESMELASEWMPHAVKIVVKKEELTLAGIKSFYVYCGEHERDKYQTLVDLYDQLSITACVIFVNHRRTADWLTQKMCELDFSVSTIHSDLPQEEREEVMKTFRSGTTRVLVATDVLARGIDVQQVNLVINLDLPRDLASYIHRVGRSGRFGRKGAAINLLAGNQDVRALREIEQYYCTEINELPANLDEIGR